MDQRTLSLCEREVLINDGSIIPTPECVRGCTRLSMNNLSRNNSAQDENCDKMEKTTENPAREHDTLIFGHRTRLLMLVLVVTFLTWLQINALLFNFTVICMNDVVEDSKMSNETHWFESTSQRSFVFSAMAIGGLAGLVFSVPLINSLGVRLMLTICGIFSITGTILFPAAVSFNYFTVLICRFFQGIGISLVFVAIGMVPVSWAPSNESSTFLAVLSCAFQLSNVVSMPISGFLCDSSFGWRSVYYVFGTSTIVLTFLFFFFFKDTPSLHRNVSNKELHKIDIDKKKKIGHDPVPYKNMLTDRVVLIAWLANIGGNLGFLTLVLYGPTYLREVLHFEVRGTGFASAFPFLFSAAIKTVAGQLSDRCTFLSEKTRFVIFGVVSRVGLAVGYAIMAVTTHKGLAQFAFTMAIGVSGLNVMGTIKCLQLRCRQHCHFAVSVIALQAYVIQFGAPILVGILCAQNTPEQWSRLFWIVSIAVVLTNAPFPFFTSAKAAPYVQSVQEQNNEKPKNELEVV